VNISFLIKYKWVFYIFEIIFLFKIQIKKIRRNKKRKRKKMEFLSYSQFLYLFFFGFTYYYFIRNYDDFLYSLSEYGLQLLQFQCDISEEQIQNLPSKFIMVSTHTTVYDFMIAFLVYHKILYKKYTLQIVMKKSFEEYVSPLLQRLHHKMECIQINETQNGYTEQIIQQLQHKDNYILGICPEGTRKCVSKIKSGYYYISKGLGNIPIVYIGIDYSKRKICIDSIHEIEETWEKEEQWFLSKAPLYIPLFPERCCWTQNVYANKDNHSDI
jgi:1-acyl-sn-glycerol-3-phosphate acyltransferase